MIKKTSLFGRLRIGLGRHWKESLGWALNVWGAFWLIVQTMSMCFSNTKTILDAYGTHIFWLSVIVALFLVIWKSIDPQYVIIPIDGKNSKIRIEFGDIFASEGHIAIPVNEYFDCQLGEIISDKSLHGQYIQKMYNSDATKLRADITEALKGEKNQYVERAQGYSEQYEIGTTAVLGRSHYRHFLFALAKVHPHTAKSEADATIMWKALEKLWQKVRVSANGHPINIPLVGSGQSQVSLQAVHLLRLILLSIFAASRSTVITKEIRIIILPENFDVIDLRAIKKEWS